MLEKVTLTGADETVDPTELRALSEEFPFVEWGILISSHTGHRMPPADWIGELIAERKYAFGELHLSLHVCGAQLRAIANGQSAFRASFGALPFFFERVQLNWHGELQSSQVGFRVEEAFSRDSKFGWNPEIIFQFDGVNEELIFPAARKFECSGLFDRSHGGGISPDSWPEQPPESTGLKVGYAGGLGPENVREELKAIRESRQWKSPFWIDMETKLFTGKIFDIQKCRSVLEQISPEIGK